MPKKKEVQETVVVEKEVQETEEAESSEELSAADEHDKFFKERTKEKTEVEEESNKTEGDEQEDKEKLDEEVEEEEEIEKKEKEKVKTPKEEMAEAARERRELLKKHEKDTGEEDTSSKKKPEPAPAKETKKELDEEPEPKWSRDTKKYFDEYEVESEVIKESLQLAVKASKDYVNVLGNFTVDNFKKFEKRHDSAEKALNVVIEKLDRTAFWQEVILAGHSDALIIARSKKFKDFLEEEGEDANILKDSPSPKDAIALIKSFKAKDAEKEVKKHDDTAAEKKKKMKDILKHSVSSSTGTEVGGDKIAEGDTDAWFQKAVKEKKEKRR
ncbi:MAG: hypothetical protein KAS32_30840 [Candidatus Peribacteraceae bacterium]|nr:hypothetical protein [Candidatus Peribacteraceae bacterium]